MKPVELPDGTGWYLSEGATEDVPTPCAECKRLLDAILRHREEVKDHVPITADFELWKAAGIE